MVVKLKRLVVVLAVVATASALICCICTAAGETAPVSLDLKDVNVHAAIESLFRGTGRNFAIDPQVSGVIPSLSIRDVPFDVALKTMVKTAGLVYRVDNDIYLISKKPETNQLVVQPEALAEVVAVDTTTTAESIIDKIPLNNTGASELLGMMNGSSSGSGGGYGGYGGMMGGYGGSSMGGYGGGMGGYGGNMGGMMGGYGGSMGGMSGGYGGSTGGMMGGYGGSSMGGYGGSSSYGRSW